MVKDENTLMADAIEKLDAYMDSVDPKKKKSPSLQAISGMSARPSLRRNGGLLPHFRFCSLSGLLQQLLFADEIMKFKNLLDAGIISQDEFDHKKKQLLDL